jgi:hypothetical protein
MKSKILSYFNQQKAKFAKSETAMVIAYTLELYKVKKENLVRLLQKIQKTKKDFLYGFQFVWLTFLTYFAVMTDRSVFVCIEETGELKVISNTDASEFFWALLNARI